MEGKKYKRKEFISFLQEVVSDFANPSVKLEQYMTPYDVTADFFALLNDTGEITGKVVADFCCGTGLYTAASYFLDAKEVYAFDIDKEALSLCMASTEELKGCEFHIESIDLTTSAITEKYTQQFDTVVMNPPFGTKSNKGIDMTLLKNAIKVLLLNKTNSVVREMYIPCIRQ